MSKTVLSVENLTKEYSEGKGAIDISFDIKEGEIVGFVGPNGAGKSTTMEMIMGLIKSQKGVRSIFEREVQNSTQMREAMRKIGYRPAEGGLYENLTPSQTFFFMLLNYME